MSLNSLNKFLTSNLFWALFSFIALTWYLSPLFYEEFYVPIFDNLDSNVIWFKMLAKSGMIFANSSAIVPNMMNGLPRLSYDSEFNLILWLYYFFEPKTAFIINELSIHIVAFFSMFVFLKRYIVKENRYYRQVPIYIGALYFALLPYWSGAGLSIAILPLVTYSLLNIKNNNYTKFDWILLIVLPLYTSFVFLYMHYIILAGVYLLYDTYNNKKLNRQFFFALFLMGSMFLLSEYRLVYGMFFDSGFVSHRTEFDIFFKEDLWESYRLSLVSFLLGHKPHAEALQEVIVLPLIVIASLLIFVQRRFTYKESLVLWAMIITSFFIDLYSVILIHKYTLPAFIFVMFLILIYKKEHKIFSLILLFIIVLSFLVGAFQYSGLKELSESIPIFKALNLTRFSFIEPLLYAIVFVLSVIIIFRKIKFAYIAVLFLMGYQFYYAKDMSFYQRENKKGYASFDGYYISSSFNKIKKDIDFKHNPHMRFISYGIEPAVALYNDLYTVDGYSTNYPLRYKHQFRNIFSNYCKNNFCNNYDKWGSKVYIASAFSELSNYIKDLDVELFRLDVDAACELNATYLLSGYKILPSKMKKLQYINEYKSKTWDIYLYKLECSI